jgi:hypothetical protein
MPAQIDVEFLVCEDRIFLTVEALKSDAILLERRAAAASQIP